GAADTDPGDQSAALHGDAAAGGAELRGAAADAGPADCVVVPAGALAAATALDRLDADKETGRQGDKETGRQGPGETNTGKRGLFFSPCLPVSLSPCLFCTGGRLAAHRTAQAAVGDAAPGHAVARGAATARGGRLRAALAARPGRPTAAELPGRTLQGG